MESENEKKEKKGLKQAIKDMIHRVLDSLNFKKMSRGEAIYTLAFLFIVGVMVFLYVWTYLVDSTLLTRLILVLFVIPVTRIGPWGIPLYFGIMMLQCVVAPIPSELVQVVGGLIFGFGLGAVLSLIGIMITSFIGYTIAIRGGARVIASAIGDENVVAMDRFINKYGIWAMIIGRGIPVIPFDLLTYGAGLVNMKPKDFIIGTLIGTIPRSIFYAWIGNSLFPGGVEDILAAYEAGHLDFEEKLAEVSGSFNLILTLTIIIVGGGLALFQFGVLPKMRRDAEKEVRQAKALEAAGNQTVERDDSEPESQEMSNSQNKNQLKNS